jgi:pimeloyl-ACP methyl ester carboxylesterase
MSAEQATSRVAEEDNAIERITRNRGAHYEPFGWHHWPESPWFSYQFRRGLGETQEGGGAVSEVFQAASRIDPTSDESWHAEWKRIADRNFDRAKAEEGAGHIRTAMNCYMRAADYYRQAEFFLQPDDPRRLATFTRMEESSHGYLRHLNPAGEVLAIPYEDGATLPAYFVRAPFPRQRQPVLICMGGLDSIKDEMWFMQAHGCLQRGISVLMIDGPGQGGALRRQQLVNRPDTEVPIGRCIDYLESRADVDASRIAVCGSSLGGYYAARAGSMEPRLAACISHGAIWDIHERWKGRDDNHGLAGHIKWVFGAKSMAEATEIAKPFKLEGVLEHMKCPYLIIHGGHDVLGVESVKRVHEYASQHGVDATLRLTSEEETGAEHCQHDNPTLGQELMIDWLADKFGIDQNRLEFSAG